jgi:hypothetical protein
MAARSRTAAYRIVLYKRVIVADGVVYEAERKLDLPIAPFIGLQLLNTERVPPGCDPSDDEIKEIAYDAKTGCLWCYLRYDDFRIEASGSHWTEKEALAHFKDWTLKREEPLTPRRKSKPSTKAAR